MLAIIAATGVALVGWLIARAAAHISLTVHTGTSDTVIGPAAVIAASLVAGLAGWALLAILERHCARPRRWWTIVAVAVFVLSLSGPFGSATSSSAAWALAAIHLCVAAVLIGLLGGSASRR
jgi:hypothetical protein